MQSQSLPQTGAITETILGIVDRVGKPRVWPLLPDTITNPDTFKELIDLDLGDRLPDF
jgi:hypothetical protein